MLRVYCLVVSVLAALLGTVPSAVAQSERGFDLARTYWVPVDKAPTRGPADAPVTIVEFSDFICPYCGRAQSILEALERLYPGQVRLVYRHNLLDIEEGTLAAEASMAAAAQGQFWPMHDRIFAAGGALVRDQVEGLTLTLGLDVAQFRRDLDQRRFLPAIRADAQITAALGITSTPVFFINGRPVIGAQPMSVFAQVVEEELARAEALIASGVAPAQVYATIMAQARAPARPDQGDTGTGRGRVAGQIDPARLYRVDLGLPGHSMGPADALMTVVMFSDFECPYCATLQPTVRGLRAEYGDDVRIVFRHFPLPFHRNAQLAAEAAVAAAAQGAFWAYHDRLFAEPNALTRADLDRHARQIGLDMDAFRAALQDRRYLDAVLADMAAGGALGVTGTPTLFVNGTPLAGSAAFEYLNQLIFAPKMAEARALLRQGVPRAQVYDTLMRMANSVEVGRPTQFAAPIGEVEQAGDQIPTAVQFACRARASERARILFDSIESGAQRHKVRRDCRTYGIDLPAKADSNARE